MVARISRNYHEWACVVDFDTILDKAKRHVRLASQNEKRGGFLGDHKHRSHINAASALLALIEENLFYKASTSTTVRTAEARINKIEKELDYI
jgi:hypothetical protein